MERICRTAVSVASVVCIATCVNAQDSTVTDSATSSVAMLGGAVMIPQLGGGGAGEFTAIAMTVSPVRLNRLGPDLAFVVVPRALTSGLVFGGVRANVGVPLRVMPNVLFVPSAGVSLIGAVGAIGTAGSAGVNGTLAMIVYSEQAPADRPVTGLRAAISVHRFGTDIGGSLRLLEIGIVRWTR